MPEQSTSRSRRGLGLALVAITGVANAADRGNDTGFQPVYLVPGSHLDLGYTAPLSEVTAERIRILDDAIAAAELDAEFVWFEEAGWTAEVWLDHYRADPARIASLRRLVMDGRIGFGATMLSGHAAAFPEGLPLLTMHLDRVEEMLGRRPDVAVVNDVPSVPSTFRDAIATAGVTRLLMGPNLIFSPPTSEAPVRKPFRWMSPNGKYVDVFIDPDGFTAGFGVWGLPPECARVFEPARFGLATDDDEVLARGVAGGMERLAQAKGALLVQHAFDNWDTACARELPDAVRRWNTLAGGAKIELAQPARYFDRLTIPPLIRGEWAMDWDVIRASEPLWTWRLREAMRAVDATTPRPARLALVEAMDHNVGIGPRWRPDLSMAAAVRHVEDVAMLYRRAVRAMLGPSGVRARPPPLAAPMEGPWPESWRRYLGQPEDAVRMRAGNAPMQPMVDAADRTWRAPLIVRADSRRLVARATLDRVAGERVMGQRYRIVLEVGIRRPVASLSLELVGSDDAARHGWLSGRRPSAVVSPAGVIVRGGDGLALRAHGPLVLVWGLQADPEDPALTWLQALAVNNATHAEVRHQPVLLPFQQLYPGEPVVFDVEVEIEVMRPE